MYINLHNLNIPRDGIKGKIDNNMMDRNFNTTVTQLYFQFLINIFPV